MAGLQFHYDGSKKAQPRRAVDLFPSRDHFYYYGVPPVEKKRENEDKVMDEKMAQTVNPEAEEGSETEPQEKWTEKESSSVVLSEMLLKNLTISEEKLQQIMGQVVLTKNFFDDLHFKIDSIRQIVEVVQENEKRWFSGLAAEPVSSKTESDTWDEILALFQGPVLQSVLRQLLLNIFAGGRNVTKPPAPT